MKILVIGSGGREHTLVWKLAQSKRVDKIFCAPGNAGIGELSELVNIKSGDIAGLLSFAKEHLIDLTIVGPETPLVEGIADRFNNEGLKIFGPIKDLAMLEGSKVFAKKTLKKFNIPTSNFQVFDDENKAKKYLREKGVPIVIKADGLAGGKGVVVAHTIEEAENAIDSMLVKKIFGKSGERIILEEHLEGEEVSILVFTDGKTIVPLVSSQDHKRLKDGDKGPNTGGMGAYSPAPVVSDKLFSDIIESIFKPIINGFADEGLFYKGVLYGGIMLTKKGPYVLEFNVRFGDPETQVILPRLKSDIVDVLFACIEGKLNEINLKWDKRVCLSVVIASEGYPGEYELHKEIYGLADVKNLRDIVLFHAGTTFEDGRFWTNGGRVLGVTGIGKDIEYTRDKVYNAINKLQFEGMHYRKDIGDRRMMKDEKR